MKILLLCLKAFEMMEVSPFIDIFGWTRDDFGHEIEVVTCGYQRKVVSTFGVTIEVDTLIEDIDINEYCALAIPGGFQEYGFYNEAYKEQTLELIQKFYEAKKPIASVCVAAFALAKSGILDGKKATTYHLRGGYKRNELKEFNVILGQEWMEVDDYIITSSCPKTAPDVAFRLLEMLLSEEIALQVKKDMGFLE